jgi:hypothetical protein
MSDEPFCPIYGVPVMPMARYLHYVCATCAVKSLRLMVNRYGFSI